MTFPPLRRVLAALILAACPILPAAAAPPHTPVYYLRAATIGCPDVQGAITVHRALPLITSHFDLAERITIEQNGCTLLPSNLGGYVVARSQSLFVAFRPEGSQYVWWVDRNLLKRVPDWVLTAPADEKCSYVDGSDIIHDEPCHPGEASDHNCYRSDASGVHQIPCPPPLRFRRSDPQHPIMLP